MPHADVGFAALRRSDLPLVSRWLAEPLVTRWWCDDPSADVVEREYGPCIDGAEPTQVHLASIAGGGPFGLAQRYRWDAYPDDTAEIERFYPLPSAALSLDYLIGEPSARGLGLGAATVTAYVDLAWAELPDAGDVVVPVAAGNRASWRTLERAGFVRVAGGPLEPDNPVDPPDHVVYRLSRPRERR